MSIKKKKTSKLLKVNLGTLYRTFQSMYFYNMGICYKDKGQKETAQVPRQLCAFDASGLLFELFSVS